ARLCGMEGWKNTYLPSRTLPSGRGIRLCNKPCSNATAESGKEFGPAQPISCSAEDVCLSFPFAIRVMAKPNPVPAIRLRGVRQNNLKNFDLDVLIGRLTVITGLSGSGKSSLAFDTLFAEGQRRYIETFSPYARQFFDRMDKPQVDRIEGIPPAIAIEQRNTVKSTRSTVGTMTEICEHMKLLWPHLAKLHCRQCGVVVRKDTPQIICQQVAELSKTYGPDLLITFEIPLTEKLSLEESLALIAKQG